MQPHRGPTRRALRIPRAALLSAWCGLTGLAYYLVLFTNWGNPMHGGSYFGVVITEAVAVLAAFACAEVMRSERTMPVRAISGAVGAPLVLVVLLLLWFTVRRYTAG